MIDVHFLRENPQQVRKAIALKKFDCDLDAILSLDGQRRELLLKVEAKRAEQNAANQQMAALDKQSPEFQSKLQQMKALAAEVKVLELDEKQLQQQWDAAILTVPNLPDESVPKGESEADNIVFKTWGNPDELASAHAMPHFDIPGFEHWIDFPRGARVTGAGFPFYIGGMARLVRALLQFFLSEAQSNGYTELMCPHMVNTASAMGTGALPDKEAQMYVATEDQLYLIPTAEVPVTNFFRDEIVDAGSLPIKLCAHTPCFRREAGSWGAHVRGLNRLHQFDKVELVKWAHPDNSFEELETLRADAERILEKLNLPYRVLLMCSKDIGFPHSKQYDLEVWAGGQKRWLEVSSCSCFTDFQARRANIRFRSEPGAKPRFVHTLNGSALAIPRVLAAIIENNLLEDGRVSIPAVLQPWFGSRYLQAQKPVA